MLRLCVLAIALIFYAPVSAAADSPVSVETSLQEEGQAGCEWDSYNEEYDGCYHRNYTAYASPANLTIYNYYSGDCRHNNCTNTDGLLDPNGNYFGASADGVSSTVGLSLDEYDVAEVYVIVHADGTNVTFSWTRPT